MASHITVKDLTHLYAIQNHEEGEMAYVEDLKKIYSWQPEDGWQEVNIENKGLELNLYDLNKNAISQMEPMSKNELYQKGNMLFKFYTETTKENYHYMLLCREYNYYTLFEPNFSCEQFEDFVDAVLGIVEELGPVYSVDEAESAIEFWIKPADCDEPMVFILFPYDQGVVYYV